MTVDDKEDFRRLIQRDLTRKAAGMERDKLLGTMDAKVWTDEFMATKARLGDEEFYHAMMLAWFANAIMAGFDEANRCAQPTANQ